MFKNGPNYLLPFRKSILDGGGCLPQNTRGADWGNKRKIQNQRNKNSTIWAAWSWWENGQETVSRIREGVNISLVFAKYKISREQMTKQNQNRLNHGVQKSVIFLF